MDALYLFLTGTAAPVAGALLCLALGKKAFPTPKVVEKEVVREVVREVPFEVLIVEGSEEHNRQIESLLNEIRGLEEERSGLESQIEELQFAHSEAISDLRAFRRDLSIELGSTRLEFESMARNSLDESIQTFNAGMDRFDSGIDAIVGRVGTALYENEGVPEEPSEEVKEEAEASSNVWDFMLVKPPSE